eukprot:TRINITY_DN17244_c0_g1_i1.p1 TRINITY_DN17244_c0_g1~~TRINITY_DN17244_c0_g1_i1.p1  ORF type:complete len:213 (+),score=19.23 TRINITY_DN17244_c0_g1_i1:135-773(+)
MAGSSAIGIGGRTNMMLRGAPGMAGDARLVGASGAAKVGLSAKDGRGAGNNGCVRTARVGIGTRATFGLGTDDKGGAEVGAEVGTEVGATTSDASNSPRDNDGQFDSGGNVAKDAADSTGAVAATGAADAGAWAITDAEVAKEAAVAAVAPPAPRSVKDFGDVRSESAGAATCACECWTSAGGDSGGDDRTVCSSSSAHSDAQRDSPQLSLS